MKGSKMKGDENYVKDLRAIARVNEIALKLKEMERILKIRKDESNERTESDGSDRKRY